MPNCQFRIMTRGDIIRTTWALRSEAINSCESCQGSSWDESTCPIYSNRSTLMVRNFSESLSLCPSTNCAKEKWSFVVVRGFIRFHFESKFSIQITSTAGCPMVTCLVSFFRKSIFFFEFSIFVVYLSRLQIKINSTKSISNYPIKLFT